jgi:hypothetical protein
VVYAASLPSNPLLDELMGDLLLLARDVALDLRILQFDDARCNAAPATTPA